MLVLLDGTFEPWQGAHADGQGLPEHVIPKVDISATIIWEPNLKFSLSKACDTRGTGADAGGKLMVQVWPSFMGMINTLQLHTKKNLTIVIQ